MLYFIFPYAVMFTLVWIGSVVTRCSGRAKYILIKKLKLHNLKYGLKFRYFYNLKLLGKFISL